MRKYAIVVTSSKGYLPGVNGMLNSLWYYGNDVDFHLICEGFSQKGLDYDTFIAEIKADTFFGPRFFPVDIQSLMDDGYPQPPTNPNKTWRLKFYRYLYAVDRLKDYDAVAVFDADMQIVHNITNYFDIAAATGRLLVPNNDVSGYTSEACSKGYPFRGAAGPPLANMPIFFDPKKFEDFFNLLPEVSVRHGTSDMSAFNNTLIETSMIDNIIELPCALWVHIHLYFTPLVRATLSGKHYILLHRSGGDRLFSFHRKFWHGSKCRQHIVGKKGIGRDIAYNNIRIFWEMTRFLNLECRHKIEWDPSWEFPSDIEDIQAISNTPYYRVPQ